MQLTLKKRNIYKLIYLVYNMIKDKKKDSEKINITYLNFNSDKIENYLKNLSSKDIKAFNAKINLDLSKDLEELFSTAKLSYKTKKELDKLKISDDETHDAIIQRLIEENRKLKKIRNEIIHSNSYIDVKTQTLRRIKGIYKFLDLKISYTYNEFEYLGSSLASDREKEEFEFVIKLDKILLKNKSITKEEAFQYIYIISQAHKFIDNKNHIKSHTDEMIIMGDMISYNLILYDLLKKYFKVKTRITTANINKLKYWDYIFSRQKVWSGVKQHDIIEKLHYYEKKGIMR